MQTDIEFFAHALRTATMLATEPCTCTETMNPGKCWSCCGAGFHGHSIRVFSVDTEGKVVVENGETSEQCEQCGGSGVCKECEGELVFVPEEYSPTVMMGMLTGMVQTMSILRAQSGVAKFWAQWDLLEAWVLRGIRMHPITEEDLQRLEQLHVVLKSEDEPAPANGALTEKDLRELGVHEDDSTSPMPIVVR